MHPSGAVHSASFPRPPARRTESRKGRRHREPGRLLPPVALHEAQTLVIPLPYEARSQRGTHQARRPHQAEHHTEGRQLSYGQRQYGEPGGDADERERNPGVEARFSAAADAMNHVSLSVFRFDGDALVTPHLARLVGHDSPLLHFRRQGDGGMFDRFAEHAEELWGRGRPV